jgi:Flp pilus assembly secretin CpaC
MMAHAGAASLLAADPEDVRAKIAVEVRVLQAPEGVVQGVLDRELEPWSTTFVQEIDVKDILKRMEGTKGVALSSYPRLVVTSGKEAVIRSGAQIPMPAKPPQDVFVGTHIELTPKLMSSGKIALKIGSTISKVIGHEKVEGASFPLISSQIWNSTVEVAPSGAVVAMVGMVDKGSRTEKFLLISANAVKPAK